MPVPRAGSIHTVLSCFKFVFENLFLIVNFGTRNKKTIHVIISYSHADSISQLSHSCDVTQLK